MAQQSFAVGTSWAQECDPIVSPCPDPSPTADPSPTTDPTPTPEPTTPPPDPSPSASEPPPSEPPPSPEPKPSPTATGGGQTSSPQPGPTQDGGGGGGATRSGSRRGRQALDSAKVEDCHDLDPSKAGGLSAAGPPYVVAEPPGMSGPQDTGRLEGILARIKGRPKLSRSKAFMEVAGPFPIAGPTSWSDDWHNFRPCPEPHLHKGLDMFAPRGTPVVAVAEGHVTRIVNIADSSGLAVEMEDRNGIQYFYAHLSRFAPGLRSGQKVRRGHVLGFVGTTGNAVGTSPHLHFEIQPGGVSMPPKPLVDRWLLVAENRARILVTKGRKALAEHKAQEPSFLPAGLVGFVAEGAAEAQKAVTMAIPPAGSMAAPLAVGSGLVVTGAALGVVRRTRRRRWAGPPGPEPIGPGMDLPHPSPEPEPIGLGMDLPSAPPEPPAVRGNALSPTAIGLIGLLVSLVLIGLWPRMRDPAE